MSSATNSESGASVGAVVRVASGNLLEMYDLMVYAYYASYIASDIFPSSNHFASLMLTLGTFGAGYLMRPLGAIILGAYMDQHGRRAGLILALSLMAVGTFTIACTPGYGTIGITAPIIVVAGRLIQGFSAGVEVGGVSVYLAEIATPGHKGFYCAWQSASQQPAVMAAAFFGVALSSFLSRETMTVWGWRIPFFIGCLMIPLLFWLQRSLRETKAFQARRTRPSTSAILASLATNWKIVVVGMLLSIMTTVCFYLITAYTPTFGREVLRLTDRESLLVTLCIGLSNFIWLPIGGSLSDKIGRRPQLAFFTIATLITAYPAMAWLVSAPTTTRLLLVELWFSCIFGCYNGAMIPFFVEILPEDVRTSGFSLAYSLATGIFGGFTPFISTYLIHVTGNQAVPALWLCAAAICGLSATALTGWRRFVWAPRQSEAST